MSLLFGLYLRICLLLFLFGAFSHAQTRRCTTVKSSTQQSTTDESSTQQSTTDKATTINESTTWCVFTEEETNTETLTSTTTVDTTQQTTPEELTTKQSTDETTTDEDLYDLTTIVDTSQQTTPDALTTEQSSDETTTDENFVDTTQETTSDELTKKQSLDETTIDDYLTTIVDTTYQTTPDKFLTTQQSPDETTTDEDFDDLTTIVDTSQETTSDEVNTQQSLDETTTDEDLDDLTTIVDTTYQTTPDKFLTTQQSPDETTTDEDFDDLTTIVDTTQQTTLDESTTQELSDETTTDEDLDDLTTIVDTTQQTTPDELTTHQLSDETTTDENLDDLTTIVDTTQETTPDELTTEQSSDETTTGEELDDLTTIVDTTQQTTQYELLTTQQSPDETTTDEDLDDLTTIFDTTLETTPDELLTTQQSPDETTTDEDFDDLTTIVDTTLETTPDELLTTQQSPDETTTDEDLDDLTTIVDTTQQTTPDELLTTQQSPDETTTDEDFDDLTTIVDTTQQTTPDELLTTQQSPDETTTDEDFDDLTTIVDITQQTTPDESTTQESSDETTTDEDFDDSTTIADTTQQTTPDELTTQQSSDETTTDEDLDDLTTIVDTTLETKPDELLTTQQSPDETTTDEDLDDLTTIVDTTQQTTPDESTTQESSDETTTDEELDDSTTIVDTTQQTTPDELTTQQSSDETTTDEDLDDLTTIVDTTQQTTLAESTTQESSDETTTDEDVDDLTTIVDTTQQTTPNELTTQQSSDETTTDEDLDDLTTIVDTTQQTTPDELLTTHQSPDETTTDEDLDDLTTIVDTTQQTTPDESTTQESSDETTTDDDLDDSTTIVDTTQQTTPDESTTQESSDETTTDEALDDSTTIVGTTQQTTPDELTTQQSSDETTTDEDLDDLTTIVDTTQQTTPDELLTTQQSPDETTTDEDLDDLTTIVDTTLETTPDELLTTLQSPDETTTDEDFDDLTTIVDTTQQTTPDESTTQKSSDETTTDEDLDDLTTIVDTTQQTTPDELTTQQSSDETTTDENLDDLTTIVDTTLETTSDELTTEQSSDETTTDEELDDLTTIVDTTQQTTPDELLTTHQSPDETTDEDLDELTTIVGTTQQTTLDVLTTQQSLDETTTDYDLDDLTTIVDTTQQTTPDELLTTQQSPDETTTDEDFDDLTTIVDTTQQTTPDEETTPDEVTTQQPSDETTIDKDLDDLTTIVDTTEQTTPDELTIHLVTTDYLTTDKIQTTAPLTTSDQVQTTAPSTTPDKIQTTAPLTTSDQVQTTAPLTTPEKDQTTAPSTTPVQVQTTAPSTTPNPCPDGQVICGESDMCIDEGFLCDGFPDCDNLYDESADTCNVTCPPSYFRCPFGLCTYDEYTCDEYPYDCLDNYDESPELCEGKCPVPGAPENGDLIESFAYTFYRNGTTVDFVCDDGYTLQGSKSSTCFDGTFLDIPTCHENCILPTPPVHGYVSGSTVHGENITFSCEGGFRPDVNSIVTAVCMDGQYTTTTIMCRDINECMEESDSCSVKAACINTLGSYRCECNFGYKGDGISCEDIDECANDTDTCASLPAGSCANTIGSYTCSCNEGYRGDGEMCIEIVLLPFGVENGDTSLRQEVGSGRDVISPNIEPLTGFPFGSTFYYNIYFTDNGVVVLSSVNDEKFSYPHPVIGGFQSSTSEQIIAPFWADADMSLEFGGDVFYQVYNKENPSAGTEEMLQTVTDQIRSSPVSEENSFDKTEFQAEWMLLITWYRLPQVPAFSYQNQTNTFQAVLVTDGTFGFTLFNYQINEMNWDAAVLDPMDIIIGYNARFGSTIDNVNSQLISSYFPNVLSRYRPDQIDGNSGLKARWIYRVERNYPWTVNTRQLCLNWYSTEPDPSEWDHRLGTCPCAFGQGRSDGGFGNGVRGRQRARRTTTVSSSPLDESLLTDINNLNGLPFCLQTSTPSRTGAGIRCCYRGDQSLIVGYGSFWQSSFVERYQPTSFFAFLNWIFEDLFPRYYCCAASRDPYFCGLFAEKRPAGSCDGYLPPNTGWMFGDPHMTTLDGYDYTYNGIGEYILEEVMLEDNQRFVVQCRMQPPILQTDSVAGATVFTSFVGAVDNGTKVEMRITENALDLDILVNGTVINKTALVEDSYTSDEDISFSVQLVDGELASGGARYLASWSDGVSFSVAVSSGMLNIVFQASVIYKGKARGLLGVWNDNVTDDFVERGKVEPLTKAGDVYTGAELFQFGNSWRISESESLFTYRPGESHDTINNETFVPKFLEDLVAENQGTELYSNAVQTCGDNSQCLFDSLATKDTSTGANTLETNEVITNDVQELMNFPPNITLIEDADDVINGSYLYAIVGENYTFTVVATDENGDEITFSLLQPVVGASVDPTSGVFTWTPQDTTMVRIGIVASDGVANSTREFLTLLCDCKNGGICKFGTMDDNSDILDDGFAIAPCTCHPAYTGIDCSQDFNACADAPCYPGVLCTDNVAPDPNATCASCPSGLVGNGFKCYDYDECMVDNAGCDQLCSNTLGGFECSCSEGYSLQNDFMSCNDINECLQENDCSVNAFCINDIGTYSCTCNTGYSGNGINCQDIDECIDSPCDQLATCDNDEGSFTCTCLNGYQGNGLECTDINECEGNTFTCDVNAECRNTAGSYKCACASGYSGNGTFCTNVDECAMMTHQCSISATCEDTIGSYTCTCEAGYMATGTACIDIDECQTGEHDCSVNGYCMNTIGSYMCRCNDGYTMNNNTCDDNNECELSSPCDSIGSCENTDGSYICSCPSGYLLRDRVKCEDINECDTNSTTHDCDAVAICSNVVGSFVCTCDMGYIDTGAGKEGDCQNIDECTVNIHNCDINAECNDTVGSFGCQCNDGYTGTGINCADENECDTNGTCPEVNTMCMNTDGSFFCSCSEGFSNISGICTEALSLNLPVIFTYIGGLEVGPNTKLTLTQKNTLVKDMSELLKTTSLSADLLDVMFMDSTNITEGLSVEFRIDLRIESGTNYTQLVTIFELATALNDGRVPPDNVIYAPPDVEPPVLTCVSAVTVTTDPSKSTATVDITSPTVLDNSDEDIVATSSPSIPANLAIGVHTINFTAIDSAGNSGFCDVMVTVKDEEAPSLVCAADWTVYINFGEASTAVVIPFPSVSDNSGETGDVTSEPSIPLTLGIGTHPFTFTTSDQSNNTGNCSVTVTIEAVNRIEMRLTFTGVNGLSVSFASDLLNELSDRFILYQSYLCSALSLYVSGLLDCRVMQFSSGSIVADLGLGVSDPNVTGSEVEAVLRNAAADGSLVTADNVTLAVDPSTIYHIGGPTAAMQTTDVTTVPMQTTDVTKAPMRTDVTTVPMQTTDGTTFPMQTTDVPEDGGDNEATTVLVVVIVVACVLILFLIISSIACVAYRKNLTYRDMLNKNQYQTYSNGKVVRNPFHSLPRKMGTGSDSMTSEESMMYRISHTLRNSQMIPERESNFTLGTDEFVRPYMADGSEEMSVYGNDGYHQEYY
ncbi:uncharacterized protein LOC117122747 [Anneissia japonica]|uniref:uncharacterized protein LOC117122747 n=1 Tax=Anneissia japonica TaxID=1529436 RepID=UPI00142599CA|nr:uncharacterized protein LOC117122747 [Anneissia japonica]